MSRPELTVVGLDAATFDVIDPMIAAGELPNLQRIFTLGSRGVLRSTTHPLTTQAWTTMITGVNAGRHGMWDFCERDPSGYRLRLVNGSYRRAPALWEHLTRAGRRVGIVNIPFTWPAQEVNGFTLAGIDAAARESGMTHPASVLAEMRRRFGKLEFDHAIPVDEAGNVDLEQVRRASEQRVEIVTWLVEQFEPELLFVVFMAADHIHHLAWPSWETEGLDSPVAHVYRILDEALGALCDLAQFPNSDVLVVSDHGGGRLNGVVNLNAWLAEHGFLAYVDGRRELGARELGRLAVYRALEQRRRLPPAMRGFFKQRFPRLRERAHELKEFTVIDWSGTRAFSYGIFGNVVLNVRGRESAGIVEPGAEYDRVREEIAVKALELRDRDTGERIVAAVHKREDLFEGPELNKVPDLLIEFAEYAWLGKGNLMSRTPTIWDEIRIRPGSNASYVGSHRHEGIVALAGPSAASGKKLQARIEDVAPTILHLLSEPIPTNFEGRVLVEALHEDLQARVPDYRDPGTFQPATVTTYAAAEEEEVGARLRDLGYLE